MAFVRRNSEAEPPVCPFIDLNDERCAKHFTLGRMGEAFDLCLTRHRNCVTHHRILQEQRGHVSAAEPSSVQITVRGRTPATHVVARRHIATISAVGTNAVVRPIVRIPDIAAG